MTRRKTRKGQVLEELFDVEEEPYSPTEEENSWVLDNFTLDDTSIQSERDISELSRWELFELQKQIKDHENVLEDEERHLDEMPTRRDYQIIERAEIQNKRNETLKKDLEEGLGKIVKKKAEKLESILVKLLKEEKLDEARQVILDNVDYAIRLTRGFIPERAEAQLNAKIRFNWPSGSDYQLRREGAVGTFRAKIWGDETELLEAKHPRRVDRLWNGIKSKLEKKYHRQFRHREDFAVMFGMYKNRTEFSESVERMNETYSFWKKIIDFAKEEPNMGWEEVAKMVEDYTVDVAIRNSASSLIGLVKDTTRPIKIIKFTKYLGHYDPKVEGRLEMEEIEEDRGLTSFYGHKPEMPKRKDSGSSFCGLQVDKYIPIFVKHKKGEFAFRDALFLVDSRYAQQAGIEGEYWGDYYSLPQSLKDICYSTIKKGYENYKKDPDAEKFVNWLKESILARWKATAVDYDKLLSFHNTSIWDNRLLALFYQVKRGQNVYENDNQITKGRLPEALEILVKDEVISEDDIDPPLRMKYLSPEEVLSNPKRKISANTLDGIIPSGIKNKKAIADTTSGSLLPVLAGCRDIEVRQDLSKLIDMIDPNEKYRLLYSGDSLLFVQKEQFYPTGDRTVGEVYKLIKLNADANPADGATIFIQGQRYYLREIRSYKNDEKLRTASVDANIDFVSAKGFTLITELTPDEFKKKYFKDFMAHVLVNRSDLDGNTLKSDLDGLEDYVKRHSPTNVEAWLGHFIPRTRLKTFEIGGKFGFQLEHKNEACSEVNEITANFQGYLNDMGIGYHMEVDIDEYGRRQIKKKLNDREFEEKFGPDIRNALKGQGLAKLLSYCMMESSEKTYHKKKYHMTRFGESHRPCEYCGKKYMDGHIEQSEKGQQWYQGVTGQDLHILAEHPQTFVNQFGNLEKIHELLVDAKDYTPVFVAHPEIIPDLHEFISIYKQSVRAGGEAFSFWHSTQGGIREEDEEIEDDPELKKLKELEIRLNKEETRLEGLCLIAAEKLQHKYDLIVGKNTTYTDEESWKIRNFWAEQIMIYDIYQKSAPKLLADVAGKEIKPIEIGFIMG